MLDYLILLHTGEYNYNDAFYCRNFIIEYIVLIVSPLYLPHNLCLQCTVYVIELCSVLLSSL